MMKISKQRFFDFIFRRDTADIPVIPIIAGDHAAHISGYTLREVCLSGNKLADALEQAFRRYKHDLVIVFSDVTVEAEALGAVLEFPENAPPFITKFPDAECVLPKNPRADGRMPEILSGAERLISRIGGEAAVAVSLKDPFSLGALVYEPSAFFRDIIRNQERIRRLIDVTLKNQLAYIREILEIGAVPFIGAPFASGSIISPDAFGRFAAPYLHSLFEVIRSYNLPVCIHICGDSTVIIDQLAVMKPDVVSIDELDIAQYAPRYPDVLFMGNLSTALLLNGTPERIFSEVRLLLDTVRYPFIPATGCDVPMKTPPENIHAMIQAVRTYTLQEKR